MASDGGGFFDRLANLWDGFWSLWIGGHERKNPEVVYESALNARIRKHGQLKSAAANIVYLRNKLEKELTSKRAELEQVQQQIPVALDEEEDEVALVLIQSKDDLTADIASLTAELEKTASEADEAKRALVSFQGEIEKLRKEKERMIAVKETAEARIKIQETLSGLSVDADIRALDNVRESIGKLQAEADMGSELAGASLDGRLREIRAKTSTVAARNQLTELKRQRASAQKQLTEQAFAKAI